jgi:hypothetical protein
LKSLYKMAASLKDKRTPITTPPYQVPSVDVTPDPPIFSLVTTFNLKAALCEGDNKSYRYRTVYCRFVTVLQTEVNIYKDNFFHV